MDTHIYRPLVFLLLSFLLMPTNPGHAATNHQFLSHHQGPIAFFPALNEEAPSEAFRLGESSPCSNFPSSATALLPAAISIDCNGRIVPFRAGYGDRLIPNLGAESIAIRASPFHGVIISSLIIVPGRSVARDELDFHGTTEVV